MKVRYLLLGVYGLFCSGIGASAQVKVQLIAPAETGAGIREVHSAHIALYDRAVTSRRKLVLMIQGTGGRARACRPIDSCFATMGYHVLSVDYLNDVNTVVCRDSPDSSCFDAFRQEILFGTPVSEKVEVDSTNCIVNRVTKLLVWLVHNDRKGRWKRYLKRGAPRWDRIIVAGHSQGAGHAAYLGKTYRLAGVIMFSGPQDYLKAFQHPAPWQGRPGLTPASRQFAFLHLRDPYNYTYQTADVSAVTGFASTDTTIVHPGEEVRGDRHILVNNMDTEDPHGSTLNVLFVPVWRYILTRLEEN